MSGATKKYLVQCYWGSTERFTHFYTDTIERAFALIIKKYEKNMNLGGALIYNDKNTPIMDVDAEKLVRLGDDYRKRMIQLCHEADDKNKCFC